nr:hypothetical protein Itr_chr14CG15220 [Ipomoea trifida]
MVAGSATDEGEERKKSSSDEVFVTDLEVGWLTTAEMEISDLLDVSVLHAGDGWLSAAEIGNGVGAAEVGNV